MCLILFSYEQHPTYRLVLAANRDEFHDRPTQPMQFWEEAPEVLAGRDLRAGGTWFGITRQGRVAAITNYRSPEQHREDAPSRGALVADYLTGTATPQAYLSRLARRAHRYNGFNLLVGDRQTLGYFSNRNGPVRLLDPGLYGLSNHLIDTPWPKVTRGKEALQAALNDRAAHPERLLDLLDDHTRPSDTDLPSTGVPLSWERALASIFIDTPEYGTRSSTVLLLGRDGEATVAERSYDTNGDAPDTRIFTFELRS